MWLKSSKKEEEDIILTPRDYVLALKQCGASPSMSWEMEEAAEQVVTFEKRANDLHLISYRQFTYDDDLTRTNQVVDCMERQFYKNLQEMLKAVKEEELEGDKKQIARKRICSNDAILADLHSLLHAVLKVQQEEQTDSLSKIADVLRRMEDIYINELTKA